MKQQIQNKIDEFIGSNADLRSKSPQLVEDIVKMVVGEINVWRNDGENPTETDLVLENIINLITK